MGLLPSSSRVGPALDCELPFGEGRRFVHNELVVRGWARSPAGVADMSVEIGTSRQTPSFSASDETRFESLIDTSTWRPTTTTLTVTAVDGEGRAAAQRGDVRVEPYTAPVSGRAAVTGGGTALQCRPLGPTAPHLPIKVRGWAYSRSGIERVEVFLSGRSCHEALYGLTRPHIGKALGASDALECGYYLLLEPFACEPGKHLVTVVATPREGPPVGVSRSFVCMDETATTRGEVVPSVPADPSPRPRSVPPEAPHRSPAQDARDQWVARLAAGRAVLDADRELPLNELRELAAAWKERALLAEAEAAARLTERAQAQRGEERALTLLRIAEERRRNAERALARRPVRRLHQYLSRLRGRS